MKLRATKKPYDARVMGRRRTNPEGYKPTVQVTEDVKTRLNGWLKVNMNPHQGEIVGRVLAWFMEQPGSVQQVVLGNVPDKLGRAYAAALREIADTVENSELDPAIEEVADDATDEPAPKPTPTRAPSHFR